MAAGVPLLLLEFESDVVRRASCGKAEAVEPLYSIVPCIPPGLYINHVTTFIIDCYAKDFHVTVLEGGSLIAGGACVLVRLALCSSGGHY